MGSSQLAQLFTNLGNPLPYDRLSAIMQQYDVSKSGMVLQEPELASPYTDNPCMSERCCQGPSEQLREDACMVVDR